MGIVRGRAAPPRLCRKSRTDKQPQIHEADMQGGWSDVMAIRYVMRLRTEQRYLLSQA